jgi:hypothetical protein
VEVELPMTVTVVMVALLEVVTVVVWEVTMVALLEVVSISMSESMEAISTQTWMR